MTENLSSAEQLAEHWRRRFEESADSASLAWSRLAAVRALADEFHALGRTDCAYHYDKLAEMIYVALGDADGGGERG